MWLQISIVVIFIISQKSAISYNDTAKIIDITSSTDDVNIVYVCNNSHQTNCLIKIEVLCLSEWCKNKKQYLNCSDMTIPCEVDNLMPFTVYNFAFSSCTSDGNCFNIAKPKIVKTDSSVPYSVKDPMFYTKNESTAFLRWKRPYPPTGILENYRVRLYVDNSILINQTFGVTSCLLWPDYDCVTLENLQPKKMYSVIIRAKNRENVYGHTAYLAFVTKKEISETPRNLTLQWTLNNDLELRWTNPNATNGYIQYFKIDLSPKNYPNKVIHKCVKINQHLPSYYYKIDQKEILPSTAYEINIIAYNGHDGKNLTIFETSPPEIPILVTLPYLQRTEEEIIANISLKGLKKVYLDRYELFIFLSKHEKKEPISVPKILENVYLNLTELELIFDCKLNNLDNLRVNLEKSNTNCKKVTNFSAEFRLSYNLTTVVSLSLKNKTSAKIYTSFLEPYQKNNIFNTSILLSALLALVVIMIIIILYLFKKKMFRQNTSQERGFEIMIPASKTHEKINRLSKRIEISEFENYVIESLKDGELDRQYHNLPHCSSSYGTREENKHKNRYKIFCFSKFYITDDPSRVTLEKIKSKDYSNYVDANYIDSYTIPKAYIATQAPTKSTSYNFWRMIWQKNVRSIVVLENVYENQEKSKQYWPEINKKLLYDDITIHYVSNKVFVEYEQFTFHLSYREEFRIVEQFHFMFWPYHGVSILAQNLVPVLKQMRLFTLSSNSPIVIYSNAGPERTGTMLLCDICLRMVDKEQAIDVVAVLQKLYEQRPCMINDVNQLKLAHLAILEFRFDKWTGIDCTNIETSVNELIASDGLKLQMQDLHDLACRDETMKLKNKNDDFSTYIDAAIVDSFRYPQRFIVTQQPNSNTLNKFWRFIHEKDISLVISLNKINHKDPNSCIFWPTSEFNPVDYMIVKHDNTQTSSLYDLITVQIKINQEEKHKVVNIAHLKIWPAKKHYPENPADFLIFMEKTMNLATNTKQVLVTCYDGVTASGVYVAMDFIIKKMNLEHICDLPKAIRSIRQNRQQFVQSVIQLTFLYKMAVAYVKSLEQYANFK